MEVFIVNLFITLILLYLTLYHIEYVIQNEKNTELSYNKSKCVDLTAYSRVTNKYLDKTKDFSVFMNNPTPLNRDSSFINPCLSIRDARSDFEIPSLALNPDEKDNNEKILKKMETSILRNVKI